MWQCQHGASPLASPPWPAAPAVLPPPPRQSLNLDNPCSGQRRNQCGETPCMHGGACSQTTMDPGYKCRCEGTGYYGPRCQHGEYLKEALFAYLQICICGAFILSAGALTALEPYPSLFLPLTHLGPAPTRYLHRIRQHVSTLLTISFFCPLQRARVLELYQRADLSRTSAFSSEDSPSHMSRHHIPSRFPA